MRLPAPKRIPIAFQTCVDLLTPRQTEVLILIAQDNSVKQIAEKLCCSPKTIEYHLAQVYKKTGARTMVGLTLFAIREGFVRIEGVEISPVPVKFSM